MTEIAAVGAPALYVPFPFAVDDHQTRNAQFVVQQGGGWLVQQADLTPETLAAQWLASDRVELLRKAEAAWKQKKTNATQAMVLACEELAS